MFKQQLKERQQSAVANKLNTRGEVIQLPICQEQHSSHYLQADLSDVKLLEGMKNQAKQNNDFNSHAALTRLQKHTVHNQYSSSYEVYGGTRNAILTQSVKISQRLGQKDDRRLPAVGNQLLKEKDNRKFQTIVQHANVDNMSNSTDLGHEQHGTAKYVDRKLMNVSSRSQLMRVTQHPRQLQRRTETNVSTYTGKHPVEQHMLMLQEKKRSEFMPRSKNYQDEALVQTNPNPSTTEYIEGSHDMSARNTLGQRSQLPIKKNSTLRLKDNEGHMHHHVVENSTMEPKSADKKEADAYYRQMSSLYNVNVQVKNEDKGINEELEQFVYDNSMQ